MSPTDLKELQGEHLTLEKATSSGSTSEASRIRVIDLDEKEYCLPTARCQTWFVGEPTESIHFSISQRY